MVVEAITAMKTQNIDRAQTQVVGVKNAIDPTKTLIIGAYGMLGRDLQKFFPEATLCGHQDLAITKEAAVRSYFKRLEPDVVINAAAYTDVDGCEDHRDQAMAVNGKAPGYIAGACDATGASLIHYSTDYIFDGSRTEYVESDTPNPINVYGESKLLGEQTIADAMSDYRIVRTSWLFGTHGRNFVSTMLLLSLQMPEVRVVDDQFGKPTFTMDLAWKSSEIAGMKPGIYHVTNDGVCSWYEFARAIIDNVVPCSSTEFPRKARRPNYSVLVNTKTTSLRHWKDALADYLNEEVIDDEGNYTRRGHRVTPVPSH
jgi:dTDP-4-dehydrorhamnose reductase